MKSFFSNILRSLAGAPRTNMPTVNTPTSNQNISLQNAQSWATDIHPNGREDSSYINNIDYENGKLDVEFRNGFKAELDNIDPQEAKDFVQSDSKGRFYNSHFADKPYKAVP